LKQRIYHGDVPPEALADYLIQEYEPRQNMHAQKLGSGDSFFVQIGHGGENREKGHALSVAVTSAPGDAPGLAVTVGQQQWLTPGMAGYSALMGLIALMVTPWVLFALIWPVSHVIETALMPGEVWNTIDTFLASHGAVLEREHELSHPHAT
jgi:hypothetical protein